MQIYLVVGVGRGGFALCGGLVVRSFERGGVVEEVCALERGERDCVAEEGRE
jgi:hypothetical protein